MQMSKPKYTASIVTKKANENIPEALLLKLCQENHSALGLLVRNGAVLEYEKFGIGELKIDETAEARFSFLKGILRAQQKKPLMLVFHCFPPEFDEGEVQPWFLKDSKGKPLLAMAFEGDFPGREIDGSSEMMGLMQEYLGPKVDEIFKFCNSQVNKTVNWLKGDSFAKDFANTFAHRAELVFFPVEGDPFVLGKNELGLTSSWGTCSNAYGYTEAAIEAATLAAKPPEPRSKFAPADEEDDVIVKAPVAEVDKNGIHHIPEPKEEVKPPALPAAPVTDPVEKVAAESPEGHWATPPANLHGKQLKQWIRAMNLKSGIMDADGKQGKLDENWEQRPKIFIRHKAVVKTLSDLSHTAVGGSVKELANPQLPVIGGKEQAEAVEFIKKYLDGASNVVTNPLEAQKEESKLALFSELCLKGGLEDINTWKAERILPFIKGNPEAAWLLVVELRRKIINLTQSLKAGDKKLGELVGTQHTPTAPDPVSKPSIPSKDDDDDQIVKKITKYA